MRPILSARSEYTREAPELRILADENVPRTAVETLIRLGHDVVWVLRDAPGITDVQVIAWAERECRLLITQDKDFGELAFRAGLPAECGIVLVRLYPPAPVKVAAAIEQLFGAGTIYPGEFVVVEEHRVRRRRLPTLDVDRARPEERGPGA